MVVGNDEASVQTTSPKVAVLLFEPLFSSWNKQVWSNTIKARDVAFQAKGGPFSTD
jgi:hypothetical protein